MGLRFFRKKIKYSEPLARDYIERVLARERGVAPAGYALETFRGGCGRVFKMTGGDTAPRVIHFHPLAKRHDPDDFFRIHAYLAERDFPIPKILDHDRTETTRRRFGLEVSIEEFVEGEHFNGDMFERDEIIDGLARLLARFHRVTDASHGRPWAPTDASAGAPSLFDETIERIETLYARIVAREAISKPEARRHVEWFRSWRERVDDGAPYRLTHGEYHGENVLIRPDGSFCALDIVTARLGFFEAELAYCESSLVGGGSAESRGRFFREYFRAMDDGAEERYERNAPFFRAVVLLAKAAKNISSARKKARGKKPGKKKQYDSIAEQQIEEIRGLVNDAAF